MEDYTKIKDMENFTQKDLMMHLLQVSQHTVTREELKSDIADLKHDISKVEDNLKSDISKVESSLKSDISKVESSLESGISKVESSLKSDIADLKQSISKVDAKFDKIQWLIIATILTVVLKDYVISLLQQ